MATSKNKIAEKDRGGTSLRIAWRDLVAEAHGIPAIGIVVGALIVVFIVVVLWAGGPPQYTL
ncbi:MAG: hypothetical protein KKB02_01740 [Alphaproteobacteria bacterium]|nr:hypothetical protein [Alphaproteobacteria bacterium]